jgi:hypothetical protein
VIQILAKKQKRGGINYDETKFACNYLRLHCYSGKIIQKSTCHASETGIQSVLETILLPQPLPKGFTQLGLMIVMFELIELATLRYKKIKSKYIYLHVNPTESASNTSPQPFWTKRGFDPVDKTLVIAPLTATKDEDPLLINQHEVKTLAQAEVLTGLKELREHLIINPNDGNKTITIREW